MRSVLFLSTKHKYTRRRVCVVLGDRAFLALAKSLDAALPSSDTPLTLATRNVSDFERAGVVIFIPWSA